MRIALLLLVACATGLAAEAVVAPMTPAEKTADAKLSPSLRPVADVPGLPRVLLIGDSVSMGYTLRVRAALQGRANVHRAPTNCGASSKGVAEIDHWLGAGHWDLIHFNFGLHDIRYLQPGKINVPRDAYVANLRKIVARLKQTGATLIWAATTPVPAKNLPGQYPRIPADVVDYNALAERIMQEHGVAINDLYAAVLPRIAELQPAGDVHLNSQGCDVLGAQVASAIAAALPAAGATAPPGPKISALDPRVWSCDFTSRALGQPMRFLVVLPEGVAPGAAPLPVIYFLHGRGRNERTLLDAESTRAAVMASRCAIVLPRGRDGWYVNAPAVPADRYADYLDEVIALAEKHFPVGRTPAMRAIGGWSMGGYGAAYTACRRAGDFAALAPIIGILDFPRPAIPEPGLNYAVPPRFGTDPDVWIGMNPRKMLGRLRGTEVFVAYANQAAERQMNQAFIGDARAQGLKIEVREMHGGHTFPMVEEGLLPALKFLENAISRNAAVAPADFVVVDSLVALRPYLTRDDVKVRLAPGTYRLDDAAGPNFLDFTGSNSRYDFTGVKLLVDTALAARFKIGTNILMLSGHGIVLEGLELETVGGKPPGEGCRAVSIGGDRVVVRNVILRLEGSSPYGYGSFFGIGAGSAIAPRKLNGIRIGGLDDQVIGCRVFMRCFGHGIFIRGAQNALVKDCHVEGVLRKTDDILAETSGPAFEQHFRQYTGEPIPAHEMTSLSEDGIRVYPDDPLIKRRTQNIRVENCLVVRMRRAICLAFAAGENAIIGCEVRESERAGYHIGSNTTVRDCRGDALYSGVLDISASTSKGATAEVTVLDSRAHYGNDLLAKINGAEHRVTLRAAAPGAVPADMFVDVASDHGFGQGRMTDVQAERVEVVNLTSATLRLHPTATDCVVTSDGPVTDRGLRNRVAPARAFTTR
jgi:S-formylglutathione hydrolase FrmB